METSRHIFVTLKSKSLKAELWRSFTKKSIYGVSVACQVLAEERRLDDSETKILMMSINKAFILSRKEDLISTRPIRRCYYYFLVNLPTNYETHL